MEAAEFKSDQYVRFCPGCGDHAICMALQKAMAQTGVPTYKTVVVSGIGCSSRMPHYLNTYGFNTIHGRGAAIATGIKTARPDLTVWQMTGDGDCLAIGGNHFIHSVRRNVDINVCLFNNRIYGLTKGQYSPTSPKGFISKSSPYGTVERPFIPAELVMGARGTFFARTLDADMPTTVNCMVAAERHKGTSVIECLVNCVIFNNGTHSPIADRATRAERTILLEHGKPMLFGENKDKGLALDGWNLRVVRIGENGVTEKDILIHDATTEDDTLHRKLAMMQGPDLPVALGVIRNVECETYDRAVNQQIRDVQAKSPCKGFDDLIATCEQWDM
ncbi:MAG TPA: 2-oxoacid:ferredoxin oxidoreductase subunit beta [Bacteroidales bacterium]|nr:2-oxoacid:ferredoxin oxidoreductase subunit beta [Bacteroidales bacterium]